MSQEAWGAEFNQEEMSTDTTGMMIVFPLEASEEVFCPGVMIIPLSITRHQL